MITTILPAETRIGHIHLKVADLFAHDPGFNGLELAWDRDRSAWTDENGQPVFSRKSLDWSDLLAELGEPARADYLEALSVYT